MIAVAMVVGVGSKYLVEKGSGSGFGFRKIVLSGGEVVYRCLKCPSVFSSLYDVGLHVAICGKRLEKKSFRYGFIGKCTRYGEHGVRVENTIFDSLMCCGCRHFRLID